MTQRAGTANASPFVEASLPSTCLNSPYNHMSGRLTAILPHTTVDDALGHDPQSLDSAWQRTRTAASLKLDYGSPMSINTVENLAVSSKSQIWTMGLDNPLHGFAGDMIYALPSTGLTRAKPRSPIARSDNTYLSSTSCETERPVRSVSVIKETRAFDILADVQIASSPVNSPTLMSFDLICRHISNHVSRSYYEGRFLILHDKNTSKQTPCFARETR